MLPRNRSLWRVNGACRQHCLLVSIELTCYPLGASRKISQMLFCPQILVPVIFIETNRFRFSYELRQVRVSKESVAFAVVRPQ